MRTSDVTTGIAPIMATIQKAIPPISKNKEAKVDGERAQWSSKYATLQVLDDAIRPHLLEHGLSLVEDCKFITGGGWVLATRVTLGDEWIECEYPIKTTREGGQGFGGGIAFARRWTRCGLFNLVPNDAEEGQGYKDARAEVRAPRKAAAPAGIAAVLDSIRDAEGMQAFIAAAQKARGAHPTGDPSTAVERTITARMVAAFDGATDLDRLVILKDMQGKIQARGTEVRDAMQRAGKRLEP